MVHLLSCAPRRPEGTALYQLVARHLEPFLARIQTDDRHGPLPRFVTRELRAFLDCGRLACGFCGVHYDASGKDDLVAVACKRRGFCRSRGARRMADTAAWPFERVIPDVPVRQ